VGAGRGFRRAVAMNFWAISVVALAHFFDRFVSQMGNCPKLKLVKAAAY
jgi:hypothetical protein